jgi:hypothetical protein
MDLAPITTSELRGRTRKRGKELSVVDGAGHVVVEARLRGAAKPAYATFATAHGEWRIERRGRWLPPGLPGPRRSSRRDGKPRLDVVDWAHRVVATMRGSELTLADGETLTWVGPRIWSSLCGLGGDLWIAKGLRPRRRGFRAELSGAMLAREDRALLTGIAAVLTYAALSHPGGGGAADFGASLGAGWDLLSGLPG